MTPKHTKMWFKKKTDQIQCDWTYIGLDIDTSFNGELSCLLTCFKVTADDETLIHQKSFSTKGFERLQLPLPGYEIPMSIIAHDASTVLAKGYQSQEEQFMFIPECGWVYTEVILWQAMWLI